MDYFLYLVFLITSLSSSYGQQFTGDCQILYQCQSETIKLINSNQNTGYHGLGLSWSSSTCGVIRQKLACVINLASTCSQRDDLTTQSTWSIVDSARNYLIDKCSSNKDWNDSSCFKSKEVNNCLANNPLEPNNLDAKSCSKYQIFKSCIVNYVDSNCSHQDREYVLIYLIGKAFNLTWNCKNESYLQFQLENDDSYLKNPFGNHIGKRGSPNYDFLPQNDDHHFQSPPKPDNEFNNRVNGLWFQTNRFPVDFNHLNSQSGQQFSNSGPKDPPNDVPMMGDSFYQPVNSMQPANTNSRPASDRFFGRPPLNQLQNDFYFNGAAPLPPPLPGNADPQITPIGMKQPSNNQHSGIQGIGSSISRIDSCLQRANLIGRHCEEALTERRDQARESRNPRDLKSNLCCGLLRYSDCFGKIVNQVCPSIDANSVYRSIPESRRQDMNSCQSFGPFNCNFMVNGELLKPQLTKSLASLLTLIFMFNVIN